MDTITHVASERAKGTYSMRGIRYPFEVPTTDAEIKRLRWLVKKGSKPNNPYRTLGKNALKAARLLEQAGIPVKEEQA